MPYGSLIEAEYEDGFVLKEDEKDESPYDPGRNIFHAVLNNRPVKEHGLLVRWSMITPDKTYSLNWKDILDDPTIVYPRPVCARDMTAEFDSVTGEQIGESKALFHYFGFQYNDINGRNCKDIQKIVVE